MNIKVNGKTFSVEAEITLLEFLESQNMKADQVVAAVNDDVVELERYSTTGLNDSDQLDLMSFVGGG